MHRREALTTVTAGVLGVGLAAGASIEACAAATVSNAARRGAPYVSTRDGERLFYKDWGTGPAVLFIHGSPLNADAWEYQMTALADAGFRCIAYDRRGHGRSSQPWTGYDFDTLADDLAAVIGQLDLRQVTLVGHSMGGGEIARYLTRHGASRVRAAVLVAPVTPFMRRTEDNPAGVDGRLFDALIAGMTRSRPDSVLAGIPGFLGGDASAALQQWGMQMAMQTSLPAARACVRAFADTDFRADLKAFSVPTLILQGDADGSTPLDLTGRRTAAEIPGSRLIVYARGAHGLPLVEKERLSADLLAFLRG